jgi:hypothetical protein
LALYQGEVDNLAFYKSALLLILACCGFPAFLLLALAGVSQFLLPVKTLRERLLSFRQMILFLLGCQGPAVFVREGQVEGSLEELQSPLPGVAVVDLTSAIVLERLPFWPVNVEPNAVARRYSIGPLRSLLLRILFRQNRPINARAEGPGVVFTEPGERIRGVVSLRKQVSIRPDTCSITRDGFEVSGVVISVFTIGEPPDVLYVGYIGDRATDIRVLRFDNIRRQFTVGQDELDEDDKQQIDWRYRRSLVEEDDPRRTEPYTFYPDRVFQAVYAEATRAGRDEVEPWLDLPGMVAIETFNNMVSVNRYADLYEPKDPVRFPFNERFRPEFNRRLRNQGVLDYRLVTRIDREVLQEGVSYAENLMEVTVPQRLTVSKVLRDRGIKVIYAGIPELRPVNPAVRQHLLDHWRAIWQNKRSLKLATYDYQEIRTRAEWRIQHQREMIHSLTEIIEDESITSEIAALRLLQAMETYAREPMTEKLVPWETVKTLKRFMDLI